MLPLVFYGIDKLELMAISSFAVDITTSWKETQAAPASLSLKEISFSACSIV
jgi:hypothetical protein